MTKKQIISYLKQHSKERRIKRTGLNAKIYKSLDSYFRARVHDGGAV